MIERNPREIRRREGDRAPTQKGPSPRTLPHHVVAFLRQAQGALQRARAPRCARIAFAMCAHARSRSRAARAHPRPGLVTLRACASKEHEVACMKSARLSLRWLSHTPACALMSQMERALSPGSTFEVDRSKIKCRVLSAHNELLLLHITRESDGSPPPSGTPPRRSQRINSTTASPQVVALKSPSSRASSARASSPGPSPDF